MARKWKGRTITYPPRRLCDSRLVKSNLHLCAEHTLDLVGLRRTSASVQNITKCLRLKPNSLLFISAIGDIECESSKMIVQVVQVQIKNRKLRYKILAPWIHVRVQALPPVWLKSTERPPPRYPKHKWSVQTTSQGMNPGLLPLVPSVYVLTCFSSFDVGKVDEEVSIERRLFRTLILARSLCST